jgi:hypothetical protein
LAFDEDSQLASHGRRDNRAPRRPRGETRELVAQLLGQGLTVTEVAAELAVSKATVCQTPNFSGRNKRGRLPRELRAIGAEPVDRSRWRRLPVLGVAA